MKITLRGRDKTCRQLQVGTTHHPHAGALPQVGDTLVVPDDTDVEAQDGGRFKVVRIVWHYAPGAATLWPEIVCKPA